MDTRTIPGTSTGVSRLVLGTMTFGARVDRAAAATMVERSRDAGITMFDTANSYNAGVSEEILGEVVAPYRSEVQIASKVFNRMGDGPDDGGLRRKAIEKQLDATLRRLGTDYLDLYYLHSPDRAAPIEETLEAMDAAVASGKVRQIGLSNYAAWQIAEIHAIAGREGWSVPHVSQPVYNLLHRRIEDEYAECAERFGLLSIVYNPLAGGLLTGKHTDLDKPAPDTRFGDELGAMYRQRYWNQTQFEAVAALGEVAAGAGLSLIQLAFRWLLGRPVVGSVLLGASSPEQLEANLTAADGPALTEDVLAACDEVWDRLRGATPLYNR